VGVEFLFLSFPFVGLVRVCICMHSFSVEHLVMEPD